MKLRILNSDPNHWLAVHRADCADLKRRKHWDDDFHAWIEDHYSLESCVVSVASDFLDSGEMTLSEATEHVYFYPCVILPEHSN